MRRAGKRPEGDDLVPGLGDVIELVSRRGIPAILAVLAAGPLRHNELGRRTGLDNKQLSRGLRCVEEAGLVSRRVREQTRPVEVVYDLTVRGHGLVRALRDLARAWDAGRPGEPPAAAPAASG